MRVPWLLVSLLATTASAQVPDGWYVFGAFRPSRGPVGVFMSHPRTPAQPTAITGLFGDLESSGSSSCIYDPSSGTLIVGERVPGGAGHSVDLHLITLDGSRVWRDILISMGVGGSCCGEIPQADLLSDGRIVVAATDIAAGPLATITTLSYGNEGVGIVDPLSGLVTPLAIDNPPTALTGGVFNGLAVSPDEQTVYIANYVSGTQGDIWSLPLPSGGTPTLVATVPSGCSNLAFDGDGDLWVTGLGSTSGSIFEVDLATGSYTTISPPVGTANAITLETATGNFALVSANAGTPPRSLYWLEPNGTEHLLTTPGLGSISGVDVNPNPETFGSGTAGASTYEWKAAPNLGGLPTAGNMGFSLTLEASGASPGDGAVLFCTQRLDPAVPVLGLDVLVNPGTALATVPIFGAPTTTIPIGLPANTAAVGLTLCVQSIHIEAGVGFAASNGIAFTVL